MLPPLILPPEINTSPRSVYARSIVLIHPFCSAVHVREMWLAMGNTKEGDDVVTYQLGHDTRAGKQHILQRSKQVLWKLTPHSPRHHTS